jgi:hypothetical protein
MFLVELDENGVCVDSRSVNGSDPNYQIGIGVSLAPDGAPILTGLFNGTIDFGNNITADPVTSGTLDVFVAKLTTAWVPEFVVNIGTQVSNAGFVHAFSAGNNIVFGGTLAVVNIAAPAPLGGLDTLVGVLNMDGALTRLDLYGGPGDDIGVLGQRPGGGYVLAGSFDGIAQFGSERTSLGGLDGFYFALDQDLDALGFEQFGATQDQTIFGVGFDGKGNEVVRGVFSGSIVVEGTPLQSRGQQDVFIVKRTARF